jgi:hypothetical protein
LKWNSIKDSCASIGLAPQASMLFERVQIIVMTFLVRECYGSPKKQEF